MNDPKQVANTIRQILLILISSSKVCFMASAEELRAEWVVESDGWRDPGSEVWGEPRCDADDGTTSSCPDSMCSVLTPERTIRLSTPNYRGSRKNPALLPPLANHQVSASIRESSATA